MSPTVFYYLVVMGGKSKPLLFGAMIAVSAFVVSSTARPIKEKPKMIQTTHVRLLVTDYDAEYRFFRDVLGFKPTYGKEGENYADFDCNGVCVALFKRALMSDDLKTASKPAQADSQDRVALIFGVGDVDSTASELRKNGVTLVTQPHDRKDWGIRVAHFRDPDGHLIEINHGLPPTSD